MGDTRPDDLELSGAGWSEFDGGGSQASASAAELGAGEASGPEVDPVSDLAVAGETDAARYQRERLLGRGGMGAVHSAHDVRLDRHVALKEAVRADPGLAERLEREAKILAQLEHPGIVPLFDAGVVDGKPFYTMPRLEGRTLADALAACGADGESPDRMARARLGHLRAVLVVCQATAHAHDRGIVHRDIKPANVMLGARGQTLLLDWGLARHEGDETAVEEPDLSSTGDATPDPAVVSRASSRSSSTQDLTRRGAVVGTPRYMSPEQLRGATVDRRSDVWSLGALLQALLLGDPPGPSRGQKRTASDELRARARRSVPFAIPTELAAVAARALEYDPEARYPDAGAMAADLARFIDGRWVDAHDYSSWDVLRAFVRRHRTAVMLVAAATSLLAGLGGWTWWRTESERARAVEAERVALRALATSRAAEERTAEALREADAALHVARVGQAQLAARVGARPEAELLALSALSMAESPIARGVLAAYEVDARPHLLPSPELDLTDCTDVDLDSEGRRIACVRQGVTTVYDARTGRSLASFGEVGRDIREAALVSDDPPILVLIDGDGDVEQIDLTTARRVQHGKVHFPAAALKGPGARYFVASGGGTTLHDPTSNHAVAVPLCSTVALPAVERIAFDPEGGYVAGLCAEASIDRITMDGRRLGRDSFSHLAASAMHATPGRGTFWIGSSAGVVVEVDFSTGRELRRMETGLGRVAGIVTSPDRGLLAVIGERRGVALVDVQTGDTLWRLPAQRVRDVAFVGRGQLLVAGDGLQLWNLPEGSPHRRFRGAAGLSNIALSHDGRRVAAADGAGDIWVWDRATGRRLHRGGWQKRVAKDVAFSPDDRVLAATAMWGSVRLLDTATWTAPEPKDHHPFRRVDWVGDTVLALTYGNAGVAYRDGSSWFFRTPTDTNWSDGNVSSDHQTYVVFQSHVGSVWLLTADELERTTASLEPGIVDVPFPGREVARDPSYFAVDVANDAAVILAARRNEVHLLDADGEVTLRLDASGHKLTSAALGPRGRWAAAGTLAGRILIWDLRSGELRAITHGHGERVSSLRFDGDGRTLASGSWDHNVALWDLRALQIDPAVTLQEARAAWGMDVDDVLPVLLE